MSSRANSLAPAAALLSIALLASACHTPAAASAAASPEGSAPAVPASLPDSKIENRKSKITASPNLILGRILALDPARATAIIALTADPLPAALTAGTPLLTRTDALVETARLSATPYLRGRTLAAHILSGHPSLGDEVVLPPPQ